MNKEENKEKWIKKIEEILELGGRSKITIRNYVYGIKHFLNSYSNNTNISNFDETKIIEYMKKEYIDKSCSANTYNFYLSVIKFFYSICFDKEFNSRKLPKAKVARRFPKIISKKDFLYLLNNENNLEHKCWLLFGFCSGLRAEEVSTIKIEDIDIDNHKLKVIGKGNKERFTILPDITIKFLNLFYQSRKIKLENGYLFKGCMGYEHISSKTISNYFTNLTKERGIDNGISFHTLRHSFATYYLMNGGDVFVLKDMLGHRSLSSTVIYIHLAHNFNNIRGIKYAK